MADYAILTVILVGIMAVIHLVMSVLMRAPKLRDISPGETTWRRTRAIVSIDGGPSVMGGLYLTNLRLLWVPFHREPGLMRREYASALHTEGISLPFAEMRTAVRSWTLRQSQMRIKARHGVFDFVSSTANFRFWVRDIASQARYLIANEASFTPLPALVHLSERTTSPARLRDKLVFLVIGAQAIAVVADILGAPFAVQLVSLFTLVFLIVVLWVQDRLKT